MNFATTQLGKLFPASDVLAVPAEVADELGHSERVIWIGGPSRWGLFRATPFVLILAGAFGYLTYLGAAIDSSPWQYLLWMQSTQTGTDALILPALAAGYLAILGLALRDPRGRWIYAVTDRRLLTFYKGIKLREADASCLEHLEALQGIDGRLRNIGDVIWTRVNREHGSGGRGPDQGSHGFRGMNDPLAWKQRLLQWGEAARRHAARDAKAFESRSRASAASASPADGMARINNRRYGISITLPEHWVGRIGLQERAPFHIFGMEMPFQQMIQRSNEPLHNPPESWNFITVAGRSGMKFQVNVNPGPPVAAFERSRDKVGESLIDADGNWRCGPLSGYRVDYLYLDKLHCRFAMLAGDGFHMLINMTIPPNQADDLLPGVDAVFDSIRAIDD